MKKLMSLLLITSITVISWSSFAKNSAIKVNSIYFQPPLTANSMVTTPLFPAEYINENFQISSSKSINKSNTFFELAIIFNEKLQQFIAFFAHLSNDLSDEAEKFTSNELSNSANSLSSNIQTANKKCISNN